ncbi:mitochondrial large ribosomal subunit [Scheffersomyces amazonensis]|uniref:mitochondrial large ribosomal subunit n=1 Tax=Scheffersomyces amazonensis TaxID=1078765 RepID=UPI00315C97B5
MLRSISGIKAGRGSVPSGLSLVSLANSLTQIRTATKKVSGSKTNKNDSAGRRLGPKAYEGNFVKPGQIIMRQRGTKIHPGENVKIGIDHTIYASEPGYVRFYLDPFHPLRKYVGVALKSGVKLPTPHFAPRRRRFGYELIEDPVKAQQEEDHMSRKEYLYQPELKELTIAKENYKQETISNIKQSLQNDFQLQDIDYDVAASRLFNVLQLAKAGQSIESAKKQDIFDFSYNLQLAVQRGEISKEDATAKTSEYISLTQQLEKDVNIDIDGSVYKYLTKEQVASKQEEIIQKLETEFYKLLSKDEKDQVSKLINTPGVFSTEQRSTLTHKFLPDFIPYDVPGSVIENINPETVSKDIVVQRVFDETTRSTRIIGRPQAVFQ